MASPLATVLEADDASPTVTAFPDGSVDHFYDVHAGGRRIASRDGFVDAITAGRSPAVTLRRTAVEPGGHAVNMAGQAEMLGNAVTLLGHLDDPVLADLPFRTVSMGSPAEVAVHGFDDADVLAVERSADIESWSVTDLMRAIGRTSGSPLSADVVFCANWTSFDALPDVLTELATTDLDGDYVLVDPGRVSDRTDAEIQRFLDAISDLGAATDAVLAANGDEIRTLAGVAGEKTPPNGVRQCLEDLRDAGSLAAAVMHEADAAVAVTTAGQVRVENIEVEPARHTGGGDRFDAGLAHALARGWSWDDALRLANACASRYIATGESATPDELASFVRTHE